MKFFPVLIFIAVACVAYETPIKVVRHKITDTIPAILPSNFVDDYGIQYNISDTLWLQQPDARYEILRWNLEEKYLIARNGKNNPSDEGLFTRIDYVKLDKMQPFTWAFCLTTFNAKTDSLAEFGPNKTDRMNPRKGCNGFPFSRMKQVDQD